MEVLPMTIIEEFVNQYTNDYEHYEITSKLVAQQLESLLNESGIRAIVTYRAKNPDRLFKKLEKRNEKRKADNLMPYESLEDIASDIHDLSGVRIALYFPKDREKVDTIIRKNFELHSIPKSFPEESKRPTYERRFSGYWATHYRINPKASPCIKETEYIQGKTEIQVASVLMLAWSEVEHDLVYKPLTGTLSPEEFAILDELNGLVLAGEIALERLQEIGNQRMMPRKVVFHNQYELSAHLYNKYENQLKSIPLGNAEVLLLLMNECNLYSASDLTPFYKYLFASKDPRSFSERIIDNIIFGNKEKYEKYRILKKVKYSSEAKHFLSLWIPFEEMVYKMSDEQKPRPRSPFVLSNLKKLYPEDADLIAELWDLRNALVHNTDIPSSKKLSILTMELEDLCSRISI